MKKPRPEKPRQTRFGKSYFEKRKGQFKPGFVSKNPEERNRLMTRHHRQLMQTKKALEKTKGWLQIQETKLGQASRP